MYICLAQDGNHDVFLVCCQLAPRNLLTLAARLTERMCIAIKDLDSSFLTMRTRQSLCETACWMESSFSTMFQGKARYGRSLHNILESFMHIRCYGTSCLTLSSSTRNTSWTSPLHPDMACVTDSQYRIIFNRGRSDYSNTFFILTKRC